MAGSIETGAKSTLFDQKERVEMSRLEGLVFKKDSLVRKVRRIPAPGKVLVSVGDLVEPETVLAKGTVRNPDVREIRVNEELGVAPEEVKKYLLKGEGDEVKEGEAIAIHRSFFSRFTRVCRSPIDGTIEVISDTSGRALIRGRPIPMVVKAHVAGRVLEIIPDQGAVIETRAAFIQGVFGVGGEAVGELVTVVESPSEIVTTETVSEEHGGKIVVGGSFITLEALRKAAATGMKAIIVGGVDEKDLTEFLGYEIGLGITGQEKTNLTLILTGGFGVHPMDERVFNLLKSLGGRQACVDGSTQIRTRMLRPEIIIPL